MIDLPALLHGINDPERQLAVLQEAYAARMDEAAFDREQAKTWFDAAKETEQEAETIHAAIADILQHLRETEGLTETTVDGWRFSFRKCPPSVEVTDMDALPAAYTRTKVEADKAAIAKAIKDGQQVPGATLVEGRETVAVRATGA